MQQHFWVDVTQNYALIWAVSYSLAVLLEYPRMHVLMIGAQIILLNVYSYWVHRITHALPDWLSLHLYSHHDKSLGLPRWADLLLEFTQDMAWFAGLWALLRLAKVSFMSSKLLWFIAIWYSSVHVVNLSLFKNEYHKLHHMKRTVNFGPPYMDQLFGTYEGKGCHDTNPSVLNGLVAYAIVRILS
jgi:sterol desaturase/sphingolipid hydroxylase (fatty acid hydroxylase superfamily)